jgi:hypothetical protein
LRIICGGGKQRRPCGDQAIHRLGIMRRNHLAGERDVGEVLAIGVMLGIGQVGGAAESETFSAGARRLAPGR